MYGHTNIKLYMHVSSHESVRFYCTLWNPYVEVITFVVAGPGFDSRQTQDIFLFSKNVQTGSDPPPPGAIYATVTGVKAAEPWS